MARRRSKINKTSVPPSKVRKKAVRRHIQWPAVFWLIFWVQIVCGMVWSPLTSPRTVYVRGASSFDQGRIQKHVQLLKGEPFLRTSGDRLESLIMSAEYVESCLFRSNLFARGSLEITMRKPIARFYGYKNLYLDKNGVLFVLPLEYQRLPVVKIADSLCFVNVSMSLGWEAQRLAEICEKTSKWLAGKAYTFELDGRGVLWLKLEGITVVHLGGMEDIEEKFEVLNQWLKKDEAFLSSIKMLNLSVPKSPTYIP